MMKIRWTRGSAGHSQQRTTLPRIALAAPVVVVALCALAFASPASAGLKHDFSVFDQCPVNVPGASACLFSQTTGGEFVIGSKTVTINKTITLQGAYTKLSPYLIPAANGETLSKTPLTVPGGLVGIEASAAK